MRQYLILLEDVLTNGVQKSDRTRVGTRSVFGRQFRHRMSDGFPVLTTKRLHTKSIFRELEWFIAGGTNVKPLQDDKVTIWDEWADKWTGELGPIYGYQWRHWGAGEENPGIDQLADLVRQIQTTPDSRRHIVSAWNVADVPRMALPPCHMMYQCYVANGELSLQMYQRSADIFLSVPFNIASYGLLLELLAKETGLEAGELIICFGDLHLYLNHLEQAKTQLTREPRSLPRLVIEDFPGLFRWKALDGKTKVEDYRPHPAIKAPIAV